MPLRCRRVTIMGLGHFDGGVSAARWLARRGAEVTVTDLADEKVLGKSLRALADVPIRHFHLGGHREADFRQADLVVVNPGVRPGNRFLRIAEDSGVGLSSEAELFLEACPARIIGVTGSNGKSTTAAMTAAILQADGRKTWLGGNIGGSLLERLGEIRPDDWVVLELSSFQLARLGAGVRMPEVAVLTNCSPNHLDWHGSYESYKAAKQRMLAGQKPDGLAVLYTPDRELGSWAPLVRGRLLPLVPEAEIPGLSVPGEHNRANAVCAATAALGVGCRREAVGQGLASFSTLSQRLETVAVIGGRRFYNDSASTTPESTIAALRALEGPVWLLAGGSDKALDFSRLAAAVVRHACGAALYGLVRDKLYGQLLIPGRRKEQEGATGGLPTRAERALADKLPVAPVALSVQDPIMGCLDRVGRVGATAGLSSSAANTVGQANRDTRQLKLEAPLAAHDSEFPCTAVPTLDEALRWCWQRSRSGDSIVLSPACASHDQFQNFQQRGARFVELVQALADPRDP